MPASEVTPAPFDTKVFMADLLGQFNTAIDTKLNAAINTLDKKIEAIKKAAPTPEPNPDPNIPNPDPNAPAPKTLAEMNARLLELTKKHEGTEKLLTEEKTKRETAEKTALQSQMTTAFNETLGTFEFATPRSKADFAKVYGGSIERSEDGGYFVKNDKGEPVEMSAYLKSVYDESPHYQPVQGRGGAGVTPGQRPGTGGGNFSYDPNMSAEQLAAATPEVKAAYRASLLAAL